MKYNNNKKDNSNLPPQAGADPALVIRGGPNSKYFLPNLRKLLKRGKLVIRN